MNRYPTVNALVLAIATLLTAACVDQEGPATSTVEGAGYQNGYQNGLHHPEGLVTLLGTECPILAERLLVDGGLNQPFPADFSNEIVKDVCNKYMKYTAELMLGYGESLTLSVGSSAVATFTGAQNMQYLVGQVYSGYSFVQHTFRPEYPVARKVVTQGYAALTNQYTRTVSYRTNIPAMDAHRTAAEDNWPREFTQIVPFTAQGLHAMATDPTFLAQQPDFFNECNTATANYNYLQQSGSSSGCSLPVVVPGNVEFTTEVVPGRSCRILQPGETVPSGTSLVGDVIVPEGGCPLIYYAGRQASVTIYDDRALNPSTTTDGCDVTGSSQLSNCSFNLVGSSGTPIPSSYLAFYPFQVQPL